MIDNKLLSPGQRRYVNMVTQFHPEIENTISFDQINKIHEEFLGLRPKYKIGYPNWLLVNNRLERGLYFFPKEDVDAKEESVNISDEEISYQSLLKQFSLK